MEKTADERDLLALIRGTEIFRALGEEEAGLIAANSLQLTFRKGISIFDEGNRGDCLFILVSGSVAVEKRTPDGSRNRIAELIPGDCFGELELLTNGTRTASAFAAEDSVLLRFPPPGVALDTVTQGQPRVAAKLLRSMLSVISGRTRSANALIKENSPIVRELRRQVYGDKLSGLHNRTWLEENLAELCRDETLPLALLMLKPDNFKAINDSFGHDAGDKTIMLMAAELRKWAEAADPERVLPFRFAGNEVGFVLKGMGRREALDAAQSIKDILAAMDLSPAVSDPASFDPSLKLSISVGLGLFPEHGKSGADMIAAVHELPLHGRDLGGDRIVMAKEAS